MDEWKDKFIKEVREKENNYIPEKDPMRESYLKANIEHELYCIYINLVGLREFIPKGNQGELGPSWFYCGAYENLINLANLLDKMGFIK